VKPQKKKKRISNVKAEEGGEEKEEISSSDLQN
jgi:hypothetical protein